MSDSSLRLASRSPRSSTRAARRTARNGLALTALLAVALLAMAGAACVVNGYFVVVIAGVALLAVCGVGLNLLLGLTGQVSFGHVGFYAIGAYAVAILTTRAGWPFWPAWLAGGALAAATGALLALPALRVRGPGLAMVTIAFGFIVEHGAVEWRGLTGGQNGLMGVMPPGVFGMAGSERVVAVAALTVLAVALLVYARISRGAWGAAMRAVRDSETAAASIGVDPLIVKTVAFAFSASLAGLAGGLFAPLQGMVTPGMFSFLQSILFVLVVMIGGAGTIAGPLVGAVIVGLLPEFLASLENLRLLCFGVLLLAVLWGAPNGVVGVIGQWWKARGRGVPHDASAEAGTTATTDAALTLPALAPSQRKGLAAHALAMTFGGVKAVADLSFELPPARVTSLIGPNGAGKSTVLNMLSGFYRPLSGTRSLGAADLPARGACDSARRGVARTYQTSQLFGGMSVLDNVTLALSAGRLGGLLGISRMQGAAQRDEALALLRSCGYRGDVDLMAADLAHVDRRLVEIARALATRPSVLLLDEPAAGLSTRDKAQLGKLLRQIADSGVAVGLVEHDMSLVMGVSDGIVVIDAGRFLAHGTPAAIRHDERVRQAYLGVSAAQVGTQAGAQVRRAASAASEVLGVGKLTAGYGAAPVLHDISIQVRDGELLALLGANGAGKSTLMRSLAGLHRPVSGGITFDGHDLSRLDAARIAALGVVLVPEGRQVFPELSVLDNLRLGAFPCGRLPRATLDARVEQMFARYPRLRERQHQRAGLLSGGEQQMLAIARALMSAPRVLLLDEPSLGLAPKVIAELFASLDALRRESLSMLLVDQMAAMALSIAERGYVLEEGRVTVSGSASELAGDARLAAAYLGGAHEAGAAA
ncbi:ATP-binding cassette domain-containing protein [Pandoraea nosoerga]|uniref:branched-chain amino acid ABC transporter ATP-binding protein/permease n=1 Tax=Pandoraea nosoerga TaxID=2508296 RepID=UPI00197D9408|nr:ATP-binding cassette domain-containing protein [Pandoraea nosoerga]MBN4666161.1 ATP-binding cassette domain-containing protein [Pandoraea nosoerga]MBN4676936.1 ATP-binding cassette domain-containing protein [Pandoraea nosoerga]MBN4681605.1 ATP-binding cassette domain-containing protein [Pandoraea nosoerga]